MSMKKIGGIPKYQTTRVSKKTHLLGNYSDFYGISGNKLQTTKILMEKLTNKSPIETGKGTTSVYLL